MIDLTIANTILQQIGGKRTMFMLGGYLPTAIVNGLSFRIKASRKVNYIKIILTPADLYKVEFGKIYGEKYKVVSEFDGIYCDQLEELIEAETGCYTRLF